VDAYPFNGCDVESATPCLDASDWDGHDASDRVSGAASAFAFGLGLGPASLPAAMGARVTRRPPPGFEHLAAGGTAFGAPAPPPSTVQWGWSDAAAHAATDAAAGAWPTPTTSLLASASSSAAVSPTFSRSTSAGRRRGLGLGAVVLEDGDDDTDDTARRQASGDANGLGQPLAAYGGLWDAVGGRSVSAAPAVLALHKAGQDHLTPAEASHLARQLDASHTVSPFQSAFQRLEATTARPELPLNPSGLTRGAPPGLGPPVTTVATPPRRTTPVPSPNRSRVAVVPLEPEPDDADDEMSYYEGDLGAIYPALLHAHARWPSPPQRITEAAALAATLADLGGTRCWRDRRDGRKRKKCGNSRILACICAKTAIASDMFPPAGSVGAVNGAATGLTPATTKGVATETRTGRGRGRGAAAPASAANGPANSALAAAPSAGRGNGASGPDGNVRPPSATAWRRVPLPPDVAAQPAPVPAKPAAAASSPTTLAGRPPPATATALAPEPKPAAAAPVAMSAPVAIPLGAGIRRNMDDVVDSWEQLETESPPQDSPMRKGERPSLLSRMFGTAAAAGAVDPAPAAATSSSISSNSNSTAQSGNGKKDVASATKGTQAKVAEPAAASGKATGGKAATAATPAAAPASKLSGPVKKDSVAAPTATAGKRRRNSQDAAMDGPSYRAIASLLAANPKAVPPLLQAEDVEVDPETGTVSLKTDFVVRRLELDLAAAKRDAEQLEAQLLTLMRQNRGTVF